MQESTSEQKIVKCRCGKAMKIDSGCYPCGEGALGEKTPFWAMFRCACGWISPIYYKSTAQEAAEAAFLAATATPHNLPLTKEQILSLPSGHPVVVTEDGYDIRLRFAWEIQAAVKHDLLRKKTSVWYVTPTSADMEADKKLRTHESEGEHCKN